MQPPDIAKPARNQTTLAAITPATATLQAHTHRKPACHVPAIDTAAHPNAANQVSSYTTQSAVPHDTSSEWQYSSAH